MKNPILIFFLLFSLVSCNSLKITEKPIIFNAERAQLSLQYLKERYNLEQAKPSIQPKMIVLHWTHIPTLDDSFNAFEKPFLPGHRDEIAGAGNLNVSAHFLVDLDGDVYRLMPETTMARHVIGLNHTAIGIENVGGTEETPLTDAQVSANIKLVKYLANKYDIEYLIGHYEYTKFEGHELWLEQDQNYRTKKVDPGENFMARVRAATKGLNFKPIPKK